MNDPKLRRFRSTHHWLTFSLDLSSPNPLIWLLLGEARSKCEHIASVPLKPSVAAELHSVYLAKGVQATTAIEGNTLSEAQVRLRLEGKLHLLPSKSYLGTEVDNIVRAFNLMLSRLEEPTFGDITIDGISEYNRIVLTDLELDDGVVPGEVPAHEVHVGGIYQGAPRADCHYLLNRLCDWLNGPDFRRNVETDVVIFGLLRAIMAHLYLAWIHPFGDGNGRTARLIEYQILLSARVPTPAAHLMSNHYNATRQQYYKRLKESSESPSGVLRFIEYALQGFVDGLREHLDVIREQQWAIAWTDYVHEAFGANQTDTGKRQRDLALDMTRAKQPVAMADIRNISPRIAAAYANRTVKTISRDISTLIEMTLVVKTPDGIRANREAVLAFLPVRRIVQ